MKSQCFLQGKECSLRFCFSFRVSFRVSPHLLGVSAQVADEGVPRVEISNPHLVDIGIELQPTGHLDQRTEHSVSAITSEIAGV